MSRYAALSSSPLPLSPEDLYEFRFLTDAQISPDGGRVAYSVKTSNPKRDGYQGAIWLASSDGATAPVQITAGSSLDATPLWSPDSSHIAFTSDRAEKRDLNTVADVHVVTLAGVTRRITDGEGSYGNPSWSPDGATITAYGTDCAIGSSARNIHIWTFSAAGEAGADLLEGWDRPVGSAVISEIRAQAQTPPPAWARAGRIPFFPSPPGTGHAHTVAARGGGLGA